MQVSRLLALSLLLWGFAAAPSAQARDGDVIPDESADFDVLCHAPNETVVYPATVRIIRFQQQSNVLPMIQLRILGTAFPPDETLLPHETSQIVPLYTANHDPLTYDYHSSQELGGCVSGGPYMQYRMVDSDLTLVNGGYGQLSSLTSFTYDFHYYEDGCKLVEYAKYAMSCAVSHPESPDAR